jgi:hypothetical protein
VNLLEKLPFLSEPKADDAALDEAEAKKARIKFHRTSVRNGPVKYKEPTSGQIRRERERFVKSKTRKARKAQVRRYFEDRAEAATILGHLQAAGVIAYGNPEHRATPKQARDSVIWITQRFADDSIADEDGNVEVTELVVVNALTSALNRYQGFHGLPITSLSPAYVLPVRLAA